MTDDGKGAVEPDYHDIGKTICRDYLADLQRTLNGNEIVAFRLFRTLREAEYFLKHNPHAEACKLDQRRGFVDAAKDELDRLVTRKKLAAWRKELGPVTYTNEGFGSAPK